MDRCTNNDDTTFHNVYDHVKPRLFSFFGRQIRDRGAAEDLTHEALFRMYAARETFVRGAEVWAWAFAIARRLVIDARRRSKNDPLFAHAANDPHLLELAGEASPQDDAVLHEMASRLHAELERIPEAHRTAFEMIRFDGLSVAQTAEALGAKASATKVRAHRVYERLRHVLARSARDTSK